MKIGSLVTAMRARLRARACICVCVCVCVCVLVFALEVPSPVVTIPIFVLQWAMAGSFFAKSKVFTEKSAQFTKTSLKHISEAMVGSCSFFVPA